MVEEGDLLSEMEVETEAEAAEFSQARMADKLRRLPGETGRPKACPRCGKNAAVRSKAVPRTFQSIAGTHTFTRNYHYCEHCKYGFYPHDRMLGLPEAGTLSPELEKRVFDFGVTDSYAEASERWELH